MISEQRSVALKLSFLWYHISTPKLLNHHRKLTSMGDLFIDQPEQISSSNEPHGPSKRFLLLQEPP